MSCSGILETEIKVGPRANLYFCLSLLNPCHFVTSPFQGDTDLPLVRSGAIAAAMFFEHLADASVAALKRLRFALIRANLYFFMDSYVYEINPNRICVMAWVVWERVA